MTNDERDEYIKETHDVMIVLRPMVEAHQKSLYGNGQPGLEKRVTVIEAQHTGRAGLLATVAMFVATVAAALSAWKAGTTP